jgi:3-hydroxyacyl-CoA dehydrogenase/enoyl-CoA hydratase/3-hydroxybutyryl-CoA epimerase
MTDALAIDHLTRDPMALGPTGAPERRTDHWRLARDGDGVAWLLLDDPRASVNTTSTAVLDELDALLAHLDDAPPRGLVLRSAKPTGFAAGADIREFREPRSAEEIERQLRRAHAVVDRLDALTTPTVAVVHGHCLGGGLELALACDVRIAVGDARLGFPEVRLGLHPGLGGTVRATALIDPTEALTLMLKGRPVTAKRAAKLGLVDTATEERHVAAAVRAAVADAGHRRPHRGGIRHAAMTTTPARRFAAERMRKQTAERAPRAHYPAPHALIDLWEQQGGDREAMRAAELASFVELATGDTARELVRVFFLRERLAKLAEARASIDHVHVVGAGEMGGDIAGWCALRGLRVTVTDLDPRAIAVAVGRASELFADQLSEATARRDAADRLIPDFAGAGLGHADLVVEAVAEDVDVKRALYRELARGMKPAAVIATNTSSLPLDALRAELAAPGRLVGLHFFNPVARMPLVEVVADEATDDDARRLAHAFCGRVDKLAAPVAGTPGFLVNRILTPYLLEAVALLDEGVPAETVDAAAEGFGMALGPVAVADRVGLDIALDVAAKLGPALGVELPSVPDWLRRKVADGELGRKSGRGLYVWESGRPRKDENAPPPDEAMRERLVLAMVNTAAACLRERVCEDADLLDGAMIFAAGFAPFRGGPCRYARVRGLDDVRRALDGLAATHGARFAPDPDLELLAGGE